MIVHFYMGDVQKGILFDNLTRLSNPPTKLPQGSFYSLVGDGGYG